MRRGREGEREMGKEGKGENGVGPGVEIGVGSGRDWVLSCRGSEKHQDGARSRAVEKGQIKYQS